MPHLLSAYWLAIIGGLFLIAQAAIAYVSSRKTDNVTALEALVNGLSRRIDELEDRLEEEVKVRKQIEIDRDHCRGALARERTINEGHIAIIEKLKADIHELETRLGAADEYIRILKSEIKVLDPEHPPTNASTNST